MGDIEASHHDADLKTLSLVDTWLSRRLGCLPGRREFHQGRIERNIVHDLNEARHIYQTLVKRIQAHKTTGGLFIFPNIPSINVVSVSTAFSELQRVVMLLAETEIEKYAQIWDINSQISAKINALCPVTHTKVEFNDFDFIAFCPQSLNEFDDLYNSSLEAPVPLINFSSDLFGFSIFTRDLCVQQHGCSPWQLQDALSRDRLFDRAVDVWQKMALNTLKIFVARTNSQRICPLHISTLKTHWIELKRPGFSGGSYL